MPNCLQRKFKPFEVDAHKGRVSLDAQQYILLFDLRKLREFMLNWVCQ